MLLYGDGIAVAHVTLHMALRERGHTDHPQRRP